MNPRRPSSGRIEGRLPDASATVSFAIIAQSKVFRRLWRSVVTPVGSGGMVECPCVGRRASWIWKSVSRVLLGCRETLDIYHASERLSQCAQRIFGGATTEATVAFERGRDLLLRGCACGCRSYCPSRRWKNRRDGRKTTEKLVGYFVKHRNRLANGETIGSSAVESQAKTLSLRLKARSARWLQRNVRPMAALVCVRNSINGMLIGSVSGLWRPDLENLVTPRELNSPGNNTD